MRCPDCTDGYNEITIVEQRDMSCRAYTILEWCKTCGGNGHIPAIITLKQFCNSPKVEK